MNLMTIDKSIKFPMIKGWELIGERVIQTVPITINNIPTTMFLTNDIFYLYINNIWYNGDIENFSETPISMIEALNKSKSFRTFRPVTITDPTLTPRDTVGLRVNYSNVSQKNKRKVFIWSTQYYL